MEYFTSLINSFMPEPHASLMNGILLGEQLHTTRSFYEKLKVVGLVHIVVLSGMNITMLSAFILQIIIPLFGRKIATVITIVSIIGFISFVGIEPPIVRAGVMGILSLIGLMLGRKTLALYSLFLTSVICILIWPEWLTSISFQLSFGATLGIILFGNVENHNSYIKDELRVSFAAQLFTVPLIFIYFRQISFIAPLANLLVSWLIAPIMIFGLISILGGMLSWQFGFMISWLCYGMIQWIVWVAEWLAKIPFASFSYK